jgi:DNA invertase Pin-like site-specific DNA recombinase
MPAGASSTSSWSGPSIDRSLIDLLGTIQHLEACGVDLYLHKQNIDNTSAMGRSVFQVTGAFAEFEWSIIKQRVNAGLTPIKAKIARGEKFTSKAGIVRPQPRPPRCRA